MRAAKVALLIILTLVTAGVVGYLTAPSQSSSNPTVSAQMDYFAKSCQDLRLAVNTSLNKAHDDTVLAQITYLDYANSLLLIMQLKHCEV